MNRNFVPVNSHPCLLYIKQFICNVSSSSKVSKCTQHHRFLNSWKILLNNSILRHRGSSRRDSWCGFLNFLFPEATLGSILQILMKISLNNNHLFLQTLIIVLNRNCASINGRLSIFFPNYMNITLSKWYQIYVSILFNVFSLVILLNEIKAIHSGIVLKHTSFPPFLCIFSLESLSPETTQDQDKINAQQKSMREAEQERQWKQLQQQRAREQQTQQHLMMPDQRMQGGLSGCYFTSS